MSSDYVIGLDFGTDSVRALLVDAYTGQNLATAIEYYKRWKAGYYCNPGKSQFRQHPLDYVEGMERSIKKILNLVSPSVAASVKGLAIDTTGSTLCAIDQSGTPLSLLPEFADNPNAMFVLWKDHTANEEADEINQLSKNWKTDFTKYSGGVYSSEWFWSKILHITRKDDVVASHAYSWIEHCDWIPALLTGNTHPQHIKRSRCAAGHKAMWHEEFDGLPSDEFLTQLDVKLSGLRDRLYSRTYTSDHPAGTITKEWATKLGLPENMVVSVGALDAHFGAVGAGIEPFTLVKVIGTSTCDMLIVPLAQYSHHLVNGICGQVDGSIMPGMLGLEAGQSAFGDLYSWFTQMIIFPFKEISRPHLNEDVFQQISDQMILFLTREAAGLPLSKSDLIALDWINGRRTPVADLNLKAAISGLTLGSTAAHIFKALVEATAFGARAIVERFTSEGIEIKKLIAIGGITKKSQFVMQSLADVLNIEIKIAASEQTCALGAAMFAATSAGIYKTIYEAQANLMSGFDEIYKPRPEAVEIYNHLYQKYIGLGKIQTSKSLIPS